MHKPTLDTLDHLRRMAEVIHWLYQIVAWCGHKFGELKTEVEVTIETLAKPVLIGTERLFLFGLGTAFALGIGTMFLCYRALRSAK